MFTNLAIPNWGTNQEAKLVRRHCQFKDKFRERLVKVDAALKEPP
jgi:hypothetical protein